MTTKFTKNAYSMIYLVLVLFGKFVHSQRNTPKYFTERIGISLLPSRSQIKAMILLYFFGLKNTSSVFLN